ncbi:MAG: hypothetical protein ACRD0H_08635, partial [Actinomycetes bacterium]
AHPVAVAATEDAGITLSDVATGTGSAAGAVVLALLSLYWRRLPLLRRGFEPGMGLVGPIRRFQSGGVADYVTWTVIGVACLGADYVTWIVIGVACLGGALAFAIG